MPMSEIQFEALAKLCSKHKASRSYAAARDVFVHGLTQKQACEKHGLDKSNLGKSVWAYRKALALVLTVVSNEPTNAPAKREGSPISAQDPMRGMEVLNG